MPAAINHLEAVMRATINHRGNIGNAAIEIACRDLYIPPAIIYRQSCLSPSIVFAPEVLLLHVGRWGLIRFRILSWEAR